MPSQPVDPIDVRDLAPAAFDAYDRVVGALEAVAPTRLLELSRRRISMLLAGAQDGLAPLGPLDPAVVDSLSSWPTSPLFDATDRAVLELTEQFVIDVAGTREELRRRCFGRLGELSFPVVQAVYVFDQGLRMRAALRQLFGTVDGAARPTDGAEGLWPALEEWMQAVARLDALDPVTAELVRLRGARVHDCRLCRSRRHVAAVADGADESVFDQIDDYEQSDLGDPQKTALRLVDSMLWRPARLADSVVSDTLDLLGPAATLEVVLDVGRNAANKIAVVFGTDDAEVDDGLQLFDLDERGVVITDLEVEPFAGSTGVSTGAPWGIGTADHPEG